MRGRWAPADHVLDELLQEYWNNKEVDGYVTSRSSAEDRSATSCATHKEHKKTYKKNARTRRMCGWLLATTGSGKVIHAKEFIGSEALSQRYFFLAELAEAVPELRALCHDDACHLRKYATKYAGANPLSQRLAFPNMQRLWRTQMCAPTQRWKAVLSLMSTCILLPGVQQVSLGVRLRTLRYVIDKDQWCKEHCDPDTEANRDLLKGFNSSAAGTTNSVVSRHNFAIRQMKLWTRSFYMHEVLASRNLLSSLASRSKARKTPGPRAVAG